MEYETAAQCFYANLYQVVTTDGSVSSAIKSRLKLMATMMLSRSLYRLRLVFSTGFWAAHTVHIRSYRFITVNFKFIVEPVVGCCCTLNVHKKSVVGAFTRSAWPYNLISFIFHYGFYNGLVVIKMITLQLTEWHILLQLYCIFATLKFLHLFFATPPNPQRNE